jgi:peroxiredoxin
MDGMAVVKAELATTNEYLQMYKSGMQWKVLNCIVAAQPTLHLAPFLPAFVNEPMPDFTLAKFDGGEFSLSKYKGKNILLMFPRGWLGRVWCPYCPYQYLELAELEKKSHIRKKYNLEVVFVLPYSSGKIVDWFDKFSDAIKTVEGIKNPQDQGNLPLVQKEYAAWARQQFPKSYEVKKEEVRTVFPVLVDSNRTLSKQLKIFIKFWDGVTSDQNISSIFIVDSKGILRLKYIGQMTEDRPSVDYLLDFIKKMD